MDYPTTPANKPLARKLNIAAIIVTVIVLLLVGAMRQYKIDTDIDFSFLPPAHAILNSLAAVSLVIAFMAVKQQQYRRHQQAMQAALFFSALFLLSYVVYHFTTPETIYGDLDADGVLSDVEKMEAGVMRTVYLVLLFSHIVLAAVVFPFILFTFIRAYTGQFQAHRRLARWTFPIWLYVAITGPLVYLMLMPYY